MTVSMRVMSAGHGYNYLLKTVVAGDGYRDLTTPLTKYYSEKGTPPGFWLGSGLPGVSDGLIVEDDTVTEQQLNLLLGYGLDPTFGRALGRPFGNFKTVEERVNARVAKLPQTLAPGEREASIELISAEEKERQQRRPVAGYDFTFSVPKSVSVLWAISDAGTQARIADAHHAAVKNVLGFMERDVLVTRVGFNGRNGAVAQVDTRGLLAAAFDHFDSRSADPQLHTHVVVSNKVQGLDGKWRAPDGRPLFLATVALSEMYNAILSDHLRATLGLGWEARERGAGRSHAWELAGIPEKLIQHFSTRGHDIEEETNKLIAEHSVKYGVRPSPATILKLRQQATLSTRPEKVVRSLAELTEIWSNRGSAILGTDATQWATTLLTHTTDAEVLLRADDIPVDAVAALGADVVARVGMKRSSWRRWNLHAEAARQSMPWRFASAQDRIAVIGLITDAAEQASVRLTPHEVATTPAVFTLPDGSSSFRSRSQIVYSSEAVLEAETYLLELSHRRNAPVLSVDRVDEAVQRPDRAGLVLGADQRRVLRHIAASGRVIDVLVGPAGTGKTTTLGKLRQIWEETYGQGTVVGLAPSSGAAEVLAEDMNILTENTAKWLHEFAQRDTRRAELHEHVTRLNELIQDDRRTQFRPDPRTSTRREQDTYRESTAARRQEMGRLRQEVTSLRQEVEMWTLSQNLLLIVDEASLSGTFALRKLAEHVAEVGAKMLLVGDWAQLTSIDSGGAFGLLVRDRDDAPQLTSVHRFVNDWEKTASLALRLGDVSVLQTYLDQGRIRDGDHVSILDGAYEQWRQDMTVGLRSLLVAETTQMVTQLNQRARLDRVQAGQVDVSGVTLRDGSLAGRGDLIVTRKNMRRLSVGMRWVKNGDLWQVVDRHADGSLTVRRADSRVTQQIILPAPYVQDEVDLAYATTIHRAQGLTVDTAHAVVQSSSMTREAFYVAMTRGRRSNTAWVMLDEHQLEDHQVLGEPVTSLMVLSGIVNHVGSEMSAHEKIDAERGTWENITQLAAEYETIAQAAQHDRWVALLEDTELNALQLDDILASDTFGPLIVELRRAEANGFDLSKVVRSCVGDAVFQGVDDLSSVLRWRIQQRTTHPQGSSRPISAPRLIAGLIPEAQGPMTEEMRLALDERRVLIEHRARTLAETAVTDKAPWIGELGVFPDVPAKREAWFRFASVIAAFRDRYDISATVALGDPETGDSVMRVDRQRAEAALQKAQRLISVSTSETWAPSTPDMTQRGPDFR